MEGSPDKMGGNPALNLVFRDLVYSPRTKGGKPKEVLHGVNGQILSGRLTAILGPSGAGKTSLLNVLAGFKTTGLQGSILVNGKKRNLTEFRRQSCYISQDASMLSVLTAEETLVIAAKLKLAAYTDKTGKCVVSDILDLLNLTGSRHTRVQHMSGGEQKRLAIGLELITNPPIMFFDEPTSGLDSVSSAQVISHLRSLARSGRAVACVIHQPSSQLCHLFDDVMILAGGSILYNGSIQDLVPVFEEAGFPYPKDYNRADFALEVACKERGQDLSALLDRYNSQRTEIDDQLTPTEQTTMLPHEAVIINMDRKFDQKKGEVTDGHNNNDSAIAYRSESDVTQFSVGQWRQFQVLLGRCFLVSTRELYMTHLRLYSHILIGLLVGVVCYDIGNEASKAFTNAATLFFFLMFLYYINALPTALVFPKERLVLLRELHNNWYSLPAYFFSKCIANIPLQLTCPTLFVVIAYLMTGQPYDVTRLLLTLASCILLCVVAQTMGMLSGAAFDGETGVFLIPVTSIPMLLFSGFFVRLPDIPIFLRWLGSISYFKLSFESMIGAIYGLERPNLKCSEAFCFFKNSPTFLDNLGMNEDNLWYDLGGLLTWVIVLHALLYIVLKWRVYISR